MRRWIALLLAVLLLGLAGCGNQNTGTTPGVSAPASGGTDQTASASAGGRDFPTYLPMQKDRAPEAETVDEAAAEGPYTRDTLIWDVINDPSFEGFGRRLFPEYFDEPEQLGGRIRANWTLKQSYNLFFGYKHVNPDVIVEELNYLKAQADAGNTIFYDIYSDEEKAEDPMKEHTGLFFFRGEPGAKTAVVTPGGALHYVAAAQDAFPQALDISKHGYNAFALIYRPGTVSGCEDLARAVSWLHEHQQELEIDMTDYSLWGGGAGGRLAAWVGRYGTAQFGQAETPKGCVAVLQYTSLYGAEVTDLPTYMNIGKRDTHAYPGNMTLRYNTLDAIGVDTEMELFENLYHGYNIGRGTEAEGWVDRAIAFWERHMAA